MNIDPTTSAAEASILNIDSIKEIMDAFDPASLLPELNNIFEILTTVCRIAVMIGPLLMLALGIAYLLFSPREANYYFGYRCYFGMGSLEAWRFTQRIAGLLLGVLGLLLTIIMLVISLGFGGMDSMDMVWRAFWCLIWQAVLALLANAAIWITTAVLFDAKGRPRKKRNKR